MLAEAMASAASPSSPTDARSAPPVIPPRLPLAHPTARHLSDEDASPADIRLEIDPEVGEIVGAQASWSSAGPRPSLRGSAESTVKAQGGSSSPTSRKAGRNSSSKGSGAKEKEKSAEKAKGDSLFGPTYVGPCLVEVHGPLQLFFIFLATFAFISAGVELIKSFENEMDVMAVINVVGFFLVSAYVVWLSKSIYVLRKFRAQIAEFQKLNSDLKVHVDDLCLENKEYEQKNLQHEKLNGELAKLNNDLTIQARNLNAQNERYVQHNLEHEAQVLQLRHANGELGTQVQDLTDQIAQQKAAIQDLTTITNGLSREKEDLTNQNSDYRRCNAEHERRGQELEAQISDFKRVETQLALLSTECNGSVVEARKLLERLDRNLKLDTANAAILFFDRADRSRSGRLDPSEIPVFVDNLSFLWRHLPTFNKERLKASLIDKGGISLEEVHSLVDEMMVEEEETCNLGRPTSGLVKVPVSTRPLPSVMVVADDTAEDTSDFI